MTSSALAVHTLASQVGGHAGVLTTEDGSLLIKPALHKELEFYQTLQTEANEALSTLRKYTPKFLGTLKLEGKAEPTGEGGAIEIKPIPEQKDESSVKYQGSDDTYWLVKHYNIKLGRILYDETASKEKVERMIRVAKETTSWETGVRLTGFQVYDNHTGQAVITPKSYGKSIDPEDLPEGIALFFPDLHPSRDSALELPNIEDAPSKLLMGLPPRILVPLMTSIRSEIDQIRNALAHMDMRMVGGSLLIIYESEWERVKIALHRHLSSKAEAEAMGDAVEDVGEMDDDENEAYSSESEDEEEEDPPAFVVKLIDFAHTRVEPGLGPDEGVLLGVDTVLNLLEGRIREVKERYGL